MGLLALIVTQVDVSGVDLGSPVNVAIGVAAAVVVLSINQFVTALRWSAILGDEAQPTSYLTRLSFVGIFFSTFLPTSVGGDAVRVWGLATEVEEPGVAVSSVMLDRAMGFAALAAYLGVGLWMSTDLMGDLMGRIEWDLPIWTVGLILLALPVGVVLLRRTRISSWLRQALRHLDRFRRSGASIVRVTVLSFVIQGGYMLVWIVLAHSVGFDVPLTSFLVTVPVVSIGAMVPVTLSGVGIREGLWILLLSRFDLSSASVAAFSLLYFVAFALTGLIGGLLYLYRGLSMKPAARGVS